MSREAFLESLPLVRAEQGREGRFPIRGVTIGGADPVVIAGPCAVESGAQILQIAARVKQSGAQGLRGGVFKPRSSPYSFQGLGEEGLQYLQEARDQTGLFTVVEVIASEQIPLVAEFADVLQIGARNMQNFDLLRAAGRSGRPVLLKRGLSATIQEFLQAAEYILVEGNPHVILCERGIRTFETMTRNTLDINAIPLLKQLTHLPVFADPSHGTGRSDLVIPVAKAALSAGADGLIVEVHPDPAAALSDGNQSLDYPGFAALMNQLPGHAPARPAPHARVHSEARNSGAQTRAVPARAAQVNPARTRFLELAATGEYSYVPVYRRLVTDSETPVTAFAKLTDGPGRFLLESVERGEQVGRYSFIGWEPLAVFEADGATITISHAGAIRRCQGEPLEELRKLLAALRIAPAPELDRLCGGAVGYIGYDYIRQLERLPDKNAAAIGIPDLHWVIPRYLASFDHVTHQITLIVMACLDGGGNESAYDQALLDLEGISQRLYQNSELPPLQDLNPPEPGTCRFSMTKAEFLDGVGRIKEYIAAGDAFQVVFSQRIERNFQGDPYLFYRLLRAINPSPYLFYLDFGRFQLIGSSPEVMVKLEGRRALLKPIAGTRPRGATPAEDEILRRELLLDEKERAEHVMLVDLGRNDLGRVCRFGTVTVSELMRIENYSHVMHIVSAIEGELMPELNGVDLLRAVFPAGTLSGAPKIRAMEIIEELEPMRREFYGGAVGYLGVNGSLDTCITIRTALFKEGKAYLQVGAGVVADSDPEKEYQETMNKAGAMLAALDRTGGDFHC